MNSIEVNSSARKQLNVKALGLRRKWHQLPNGKNVFDAGKGKTASAAGISVYVYSFDVNSQ